MPPRVKHSVLSALPSRHSSPCFFISTHLPAIASSNAAFKAPTRNPTLPRRTFTSTSHRHEETPASLARHAAQRRARETPSMKMQMKKDSRVTLPNDIGLLPETFIMPTGKNLPSMIYETRKRLKVEWTRMKNKLQNFLLLLVYKYADSLRPRPSLELRQRSKIARELYELMNQALADKDTAALRSICSDGLYDSIRQRLSWRDPNENLYWSLYSSTSPTASPVSSSSSSDSGFLKRLFGRNTIKATVISDRAAPLPYPHSPANGPKNRLRQVVVRLESAQRLVRWRLADGHDRELQPERGHKHVSQDTEQQQQQEALLELKREIFAQEVQQTQSTSRLAAGGKESLDILDDADDDVINDKIEILSATGFPQPLVTREYLVLQQRLMNGLQEPWTVWGTAEETGFEVVERWERGDVPANAKVDA